MRPKMSFVMPIGRRRFLQQSVRSIQLQCMAEWELLLFNNKGMEFDVKDERIRVIDTDDWSPPKCYNEARKLAQSDYILICGDDDIYFRERGFVTYQYLENGADYFASSCITVDKHRRPLCHNRVNAFDLQYHRRIANSISLPFAGYNKNKVPDFREEFKICHDYLFTLECGINKLNIICSHIPLGEKRVWEDSLYYSTGKKEINEELVRVRTLMKDPKIRDSVRTRNEGRKIIKIISKHFGDKMLKGAEVGVFYGINAYRLLRSLNIERLYLIDSYDKDILIDLDADRINNRAERNLEEFQSKLKWIKEPSVEAADSIEDKSLDFVYIDAAHDYDSVTEDIEAWLPKIKSGGIMSGHDYDGKFNVRGAVEDWSLQSKIPVYNDEDATTDWWAYV